MIRSSLAFTKVLGCLSVLMLFSRCDLPTEPPDFSLQTSVKAPLILDRTFVLLGPDESGYTPLIDSTEASFDTLFSVDPTSNRLLINQELDELEFGDLDDLISDISLDPLSVGVSMGSLEYQSFETETFGSEVGLFVSPELNLGAAPVNPSVPSYPIGNALVPPTVDLINLSNVEVEFVRLSSNTSNVNQFVFTLTNGLASGSLTDGLGGAPLLILEQDDNGSPVEIAQARFDGMPGPGQQAGATMSVAGEMLTSDASYRLVISTTEGDTPLANNPTDVQIETLVRPLEYAETGVTSIEAQTGIDASGDALSLGGDTDFSGIVAAGGSITISIANSLPFEVTLTDLTVRNLGNVGTIPAPSVMLDLDDLEPGTSTTIPASTSLDLVFSMAGAAIANEIEVDVVASSPGAPSNAVIDANGGLFTTVVGTVTVDELYFVPDAEVFTSNGLLAIEVDDVSFESGQEYVELEGGTLLIEEITNQMNLDMDLLQFSLPGFRAAPFAPSDSLVIRFSGSTENPANMQFSQLSGATTVRDIAIDLTGVRIYPVDNEAPYNVFAVSEAGEPTSLNINDQIVASIAPRDLVVSKVYALMSASTVDLTEDTNGDGNLEIMSDSEAEVMDMSSLDALTEYDMDGFQFNGTQFTFNIDTNLGADIVFYAAMMGVTSEGEEVFLSGRNDFAVSASDTMAARFVLNGVPIAPENLIRFTIPSAPSADEVSTQIVEINATNSNLDAFISELPQEFRYVGKGLVQGANGGLVQLHKPFTIGASIGAAIPLSFTGSFAVDDTMDVDLASLEDLTEPDAEVQINQGSLVLNYTNGLPVGIDLEIEVLDAYEQVILTLPATDGETYTFTAAPVTGAGTASGTESGSIEIGITDEQMRTLSRGKQARVNLRVNTNGDNPATLRATDTVQFELYGRFDLTVQIEE